MAAADEYERGRLTNEGLTEVRVQAWQYHDERRGISPEAELSGLRAVMYRLWPIPGVSRWHEEAWHFLNFCVEAGLPEGQLLDLLREQFPNVLGGRGRA
jgi:hypothetical protein